MPQIKKEYPGKSAGEIYEKVDEVMERLSTKMGLKYAKDPDARTGKVSKLGISGTYLAVEFPMLIPGTMKKQVQDDIERRLNALFS